MRVEHVNNATIRLHHERIDGYMEVWRVHTPTWHWNMHGPGNYRGRVLGSDENAFVAIEKAMAALAKIVSGEY